MPKLFLISFLTIFPSVAFAQMVDSLCLNNCTNHGFQFLYCQFVCSYPTNFPYPPNSTVVYQSIIPKYAGISNAINGIAQYYAQQESMKEQVDVAREQIIENYERNCMIYYIQQGYSKDDCIKTCMIEK